MTQTVKRRFYEAPLLCFVPMFSITFRQAQLMWSTQLAIRRWIIDDKYSIYLPTKIYKDAGIYLKLKCLYFNHLCIFIAYLLFYNECPAYMIDVKYTLVMCKCVIHSSWGWFKNVNNYLCVVFLFNCQYTSDYQGEIYRWRRLLLFAMSTTEPILLFVHIIKT